MAAPTFAVRLDAAKTIGGFDAMPQQVRDALIATTRRLDAALVNAARIEAGEQEHVRTGAFVASIRGETWIGKQSVGGSVRSSGPEAGILEYGGTIPAHDIAPSAKKALAFLMTTAQIFAELVHHPASRIEKRAPLHKALDDIQAEIVSEYQAAAGGVVAKVNE